MSLKEIAKIGLSSRQTVRKMLDKYNIPLRESSVKTFGRYVNGIKQRMENQGCPLSGQYIWQLYRHAKDRNIYINLSPKDLWDLFLKQDKKCAISGLDIKFYEPGENRSDTTASVDRVDSSGSYTIDNVHWVHKHLNQMKWNFDLKYFINICKIVAKKWENNE